MPTKPDPQRAEMLGEWGGLGVHWELWAAASGMTNLEALQMATIGGIKTLGLDADLGTIEKGKIADFLLIDGDPTRDIRDTQNIRLVVKNGEVFDGETLDQVWPINEPLDYQPWWQGSAPAIRKNATRAGGAPGYNEAARFGMPVDSTH